MSRRIVLLLLLPMLLSACARQRYFPERATREYPFDLHTINTVDIQVFRERDWLVVVNSTANSYYDFDLWVNQRYVRPIEKLEAGQTLRLSLWEFYDVRGEVIEAGGLFYSRTPTPVRLVEIQPAPDAEMIGLITIRAEEPEFG